PGAAGAAPGQTPARPADGVAAEAIGQIRSPYCPGLMLEVCPSPQAELLRDSIRMMAAEGRRPKEIVEAVIAAHGEEWRAVPKRSGAGAWAWVMPPAVLLLGLGLVATRLRSMRSARAAILPGGGISDEERAALDAALRDYERQEEAR
ncbi:MAG TPA: cytochrome c-type biogenesis protein CcmH, partial [Longimicrobium sp.]|nr:cytochrome c-type biogenesis protein CcmH [Longimicrobium sp.]